MPRRATLRASDDDRESVSERLRQATSEGRLGTEELEHRLEGLFAARTYGQLDALIADLPVVGAESRRRVHRPDWMPRGVAALLVLIVVPVVVAVATAVVLTLMALLVAWSVWIAAGWLVFRSGSCSRSGRRGGRDQVDGYQPPLALMQRVARETGRYARQSRAFWA